MSISREQESNQNNFMEGVMNNVGKNGFTML